MMRSSVLLTILLALNAAAASAHISFAEPQAKAGSYYAGFLRVSHGCETSPTISIRVEIPEGVDIARPQPKPGWKLTIEHGPLAQPVRSEMGALVNERVTAVAWTGDLPADEFDQFGIMLKLPAQAGAIYFPSTQRCKVGSSAWTDTPATPTAEGAARRPAPKLTVTAGATPAPMGDGDMTVDHSKMQH